MSLRLIATGVLTGILVSFSSSVMVFACSFPDGVCPPEVPIKECESAGCDVGGRHKIKQTWDTIPLIEPISGGDTITVNPRDDLPIFVYVNRAWNWIEKVAIGIVTLWVLVSGGMIVITGGDQSARGTWIEHIKWAIIGLILLALIGTILNFFNASFFV